MKPRFWFYLAALIIIIGLLTGLLSIRNAGTNEVARLDQIYLERQLQDLNSYLANQEDERKLISLAKKLHHADWRLLQPIIERAYEINPNSRDIALLASVFRPELKQRVRELDPLYPL